MTYCSGIKPGAPTAPAYREASCRKAATPSVAVLRVLPNSCFNTCQAARHFHEARRLGAWSSSSSSLLVLVLLPVVLVLLLLLVLLNTKAALAALRAAVKLTHTACSTAFTTSHKTLTF
eukprot:scaffold6254_cov138-Amphora_coffeaeformis.AAC.1